MTWDEYYIGLAEYAASKSKDVSTKVGAVIVANHSVASTGYNGFPRGVDDSIPGRNDRPAKYMFTEHAERNSIFNAARTGTKLEGATMYLMFGPGPCHDCARAIIQAGIKKVVMPTDNQFPGKGKQWDESIATGVIMLREAGVEVVSVDRHKSETGA